MGKNILTIFRSKILFILTYEINEDTLEVPEKPMGAEGQRHKNTMNPLNTKDFFTSDLIQRAWNGS